jgi:2-polyprenyl-6-methoxyphenol hydroxylase-like FAD-dependent oxidoreductase
MRGGRVAVVGGSVAGCCAALAAARCGAEEVVVFERAAEDLRDRGVGLAIQNDRYAELRDAGFVDDAMPFVQQQRRLWLVRDESAHASDADPTGRPIAIQPFAFRSYNWGSLWRELRSRIPESVDYRADATVTAVNDGADGATVTLADGSSESFDLVIGADGYRSVTREAVTADAEGAVPEFAGYLAWRGTLPTKRFTELSGMLKPGQEWQEHDSITIGFDGGHLIGYAIPGPDGDTVFNWLVYSAPPAGLDLKLENPTSLPPGTVAEELYEHLDALVGVALPEYWAAVVRLTPRERMFIQPIYDLAVPAYAGRRVVLLGDAATVARPHLGAGAVKALQDAAVLEKLWREAGSWSDLLSRYDAERRAVGHSMMVIGRRIGRAQVTDTPDWGAYDQAGFEAWWRQLTAAPDGTDALGGRQLKR